jgi:hypothetical protein
MSFIGSCQLFFLNKEFNQYFLVSLPLCSIYPGSDGIRFFSAFSSQFLSALHLFESQLSAVLLLSGLIDLYLYILK